MVKALRYRLRYGSQGAVPGSQKYGEEFFGKNRRRFGPPRKTGARPMHGIDAGVPLAARVYTPIPRFRAEGKV